MGHASGSGNSTKARVRSASRQPALTEWLPHERVIVSSRLFWQTAHALPEGGRGAEDGGDGESGLLWRGCLTHTRNAQSVTARRTWMINGVSMRRIRTGPTTQPQTASAERAHATEKTTAP